MSKGGGFKPYCALLARSARGGAESLLVWRFRSPHHSCGEPDCGLLNQSHTRIKGLLVSFDSEIRK
jgi:hypothetical protein